MATLDVRARLGAELKRLVRDPREWPIRDRRRFRNLLLDAVSSDAMPVTELLLRAHDDGLLRTFPDRSAPRAVWDVATARLASDLQVQRFVEPGIARFVAESWASALGPEVVPMAKVAVPRAPVQALRQPPRSSATVATAQQRAAAAAQSSSAVSASTKQVQRLTKLVLGAMAVMLSVFALTVFRQNSDLAAEQAAIADSTAPMQPVSPALPRTDSAVATAAAVTALAATVNRAPRPVEVGVAPVRTTDDIVLTTGRVFEGRVLSIRQQSIVVKDEATGLDFEIAKGDLDRIVTREGRVMQFGDDNVPLIADDDDFTLMSHAGRYRARYTERWGTERGLCSNLARRFAPGAEVEVRHLRGAPMMRLEFIGGQGFTAAVRADGLFESGVVMSPARGPDASFVSTRISGRVSRSGMLEGVVRLTAIRVDGAVVCDLALTLRGDRQS